MRFAAVALSMLGLAGAARAAEPARPAPLLVLGTDTLKARVEAFNAGDRELYPQHVPNAAAYEFLRRNVPLFECPDQDLEEAYLFRWWTYRKHLKQTPEGFVVTEFLPRVDWAGKHNTISCAAGHHLYEGRWLADARPLDEYSTFWFRRGGDPRRYSFWAADAVWNRALVTGDTKLAVDLLPDLAANWEAWEKSRRDPNGLYWQNDGEDGMEVSVGGSGYRVTIASYQYGDALALARIADLADNKDLAAKFRERAARIKKDVQERLWDPQAAFFKVSPRGGAVKLADVRELHGYTPWYFGLPDPPYAVAWRQVTDPQGFQAPSGPTTAERRHPRFALSYQGHECQWNGPSWPYATAVTLTALANLLHSDTPAPVGRRDYLDLLRTYAKSHRLTRGDGKVVPWIDENLNPLTGDWIARTRLKTWKNGTWDPGKGGEERGKDYNHSTFCDLVITGLVGLRPREDETVEVNPLVPEGAWDYFALDGVRYRGRAVTVLWDRTGQRYRKGAGLRVFADGKEVAAAPKLTRVTAPLPPASGSGVSATETPAETAGGWVKHPGNPVVGGKLGTCFDVAVLREGGRYRMWFSWRPKASLALVESEDGVHWGDPVIVLGPNKATDWEADVNRPTVLKRGDTYHLWYTGQARGRSWIGYATSPDGKAWKRTSERPVLASEAAWEKGAVMCPHVLWDEGAGVFRMWYSAGGQHEPDAIGHATSPDGLTWTKHPDNPVFRPDPRSDWEKHLVTGCQVVRRGDGYLMFYIGFRDIDHARIGVARSRDGVTGWRRHPANPIIRPGKEQWDHDACYKPYAIFDGRRWVLWYNGRRGGSEQIGVATHEGEDLGF